MRRGNLPTASPASNDKTLSGVIRAHVCPRLSADADRRVTFDRAVWTKALVFATDAAHVYGG